MGLLSSPPGDPSRGIFMLSVLDTPFDEVISGTGGGGLCLVGGSLGSFLVTRRDSVGRDWMASSRGSGSGKRPRGTGVSGSDSDERFRGTRSSGSVTRLCTTHVSVSGTATRTYGTRGFGMGILSSLTEGGTGGGLLREVGGLGSDQDLDAVSSLSCTALFNVGDLTDPVGRSFIVAIPSAKLGIPG